MKSKVLVVDDNPLNIELLDAYLKSSGYEISTATNGKEALALINANPPDLILLDIMMPEIDGYEVCRRVKSEPSSRTIPIILLTALHDVQDRITGIEAGCDDFISKPFNNIELLTRVKSLLRIKALNDELEDMENVLYSLASIIEAKDPYTRGHSERVAVYAVKLAKELSLSKDDQILLKRAGLLHDIGKIGIPGIILNKPSELTEDELKEINKHSVISENILKPLKFASNIIPIIRYHHERWDGSGMPDGLKGKEIPLLARILMIADIYDALTTDRSYRSKLSTEEALEILHHDSNKVCDPELVIKFDNLIRKYSQENHNIFLETPAVT